MSYDGQLFFGLLGDYDEMADLDEFAADLRAAIDELATAAGVPPNGAAQRARAAGVAADQEPGLRRALLVVARRGLGGRGGRRGRRARLQRARRLGARRHRDGPGPGAAGAAPTRRPSGPHSDALVTRDRQPLDRRPARARARARRRRDPLRRRRAAGRRWCGCRSDVAGPFDAELAAAGQAVILARAPGRRSGHGAGVEADPAGRRPGRPGSCSEFAEFWLGRGIP